VKPVLPGAAIGVLGSGQLGRMFTIAARRMGYRVHTFSPDADTPTGQVADVEVTASYDDLRAVREFARRVGVVTFEFENVPAAAARAAAECVPVRPAGSVLHTTQQRAREKTFLAQSGFPVTPFRVVTSAAELGRALDELGTPAVLKSAAFGYDGKGQFAIQAREQAAEAWRAVGGKEGVLEAFIDFEKEISVVGARGADGCFEHFGAIENRHEHHILDVSFTPARIPERLESEAVEIAHAVMEELNVAGVLCVEFFITRDGRLLINELAPRPHNSGHLTIDACITSQFEQQLRAVCGLPLGSTRRLQPAAMANLLGDLWNRHEPNWQAATAFPGVKLHLYGKTEPRPGRKMGHLTALGETAEQAVQLVLAARASLERTRDC